MRVGYMYDLPNRSFYDPHSSNMFHKHIGFHPEIIKQLVMSPDFDSRTRRILPSNSGTAQLATADAESAVRPGMQRRN